jgi:ankyrin repeat protein
VEVLWKYGADPRARYFGATPADWALHAEHVEMARLHAEKSRLLLDAVATGHVTLAAELLRDNPECLRERTPWGDTALHRLPKDADRAQPLIELLLSQRADADAMNDAGKTPAQKLEAEGLDQIADLLEAARGRQ